MKLTKEQKALCGADREKVQRLCRENRWSDAYEVYSSSPWVNESAKGSFEDFKSRQQARMRKEDGGIVFAVKNALATALLIVASFFAISSTMKGMLASAGSPIQIAFLVVAIASTGLAALMYFYKKRLTSGR